MSEPSSSAPSSPPSSTAPTGADHRRGPFRVGDLVQLTDPKGKHHTFTLIVGREFHTHKGSFAHDDLIGAPEGSVVRTTKGVEYVAFRPRLADFVLSMPRGAAVVYPKDAAQVVQLADVFPGASVVEAGVGSGALTCSLLRAVGDGGTVASFERREDFAGIARGNVERFFGSAHPSWSLTVGDLQDQLPVSGLHDVDRVVLDMLAPWECLDAVADALVPGGIVIAYVATTTQLSRFTEALRDSDRFTEPEASETMLRTWHLEGLAVRPDHRMIGHTGFLVWSRRFADGVVPPVRRRRPAKGAYGEEAVPASEPLVAGRFAAAAAAKAELAALGGPGADEVADDVLDAPHDDAQDDAQDDAHEAPEEAPYYAPADGADDAATRAAGGTGQPDA